MPREGLWPAVAGNVLCGVEEGFVERERFYQWRDLTEQPHDLLRDLTVAVEARRDADCLATEAQGAAHRHRRADAEAAGLVGGGHDDAPPFGRPADDDGLATQLGVVELLYGGIEGVEVGVDDYARHEAIIAPRVGVGSPNLTAGEKRPSV